MLCACRAVEIVTENLSSRFWSVVTCWALNGEQRLMRWQFFAHMLMVNHRNEKSFISSFPSSMGVIVSSWSGWVHIYGVHLFVALPRNHAQRKRERLEPDAATNADARALAKRSALQISRSSVLMIFPQPVLEPVVWMDNASSLQRMCDTDYVHSALFQPWCSVQNVQICKECALQPTDKLCTILSSICPDGIVVLALHGIVFSSLCGRCKGAGDLCVLMYAYLSEFIRHAVCNFCARAPTNTE